MKIFSAAQIKQWNKATIEQEPISSYNLMERAAKQLSEKIVALFPEQDSFTILCGGGNNGGDGLAIARLLSENNKNIEVFILFNDKNPTIDTALNLKLLPKNIRVKHILQPDDIKYISKNSMLIDAIFGTGINDALQGFYRNCVAVINQLENYKIAIDLPSGLSCDMILDDFSAIKCNITLTIQQPKLSFFLAEAAQYTGDWHVIDIGLNKGYYEKTKTSFYLIDVSLIKGIHKIRNKFSHKGTYGHSFIASGEYGKIGAAVLCAQACLRSGTGLLTVHVPLCGYEILQSTSPEAMISCGFEQFEIAGEISDLEKYNALGIGCGIGTNQNAVTFLEHILLRNRKPIVLDADALNILSLNKHWWSYIQANTIITPHPKEFERLFGKSKTHFERLQLQIEMSKKHQIIIVLKGAYTSVTTPEGSCYFNSTGNAGMATGGSGDVLTGIITGLLAQNYTPKDAAILGVYIHGLAADIALQHEESMESLIASSIIKNIGKAFKSL